jgi:hypothetical protein
MRVRLAARQNGRMDPRLRAAVDASRHWYDDVFALHGIPVRVEDGLWSALAAPPRWHSAAKTLEPAVGTERVVGAVAGLEHCAVADSFGEIEPERHGFQLLIDARWVHRDPCRGAPDQMPGGWSVIETVDDLAEWAAAHDYTDVLPAGVLQHPAFRILALRHDGSLVGGAVTHDGGGGALGLSNTWGEGSPTASGEVLAAVAALHPDRAVTDFAQGAELDALLAAGFTAVGPQRVWVR